MFLNVCHYKPLKQAKALCWFCQTSLELIGRSIESMTCCVVHAVGHLFIIFKVWENGSIAKVFLNFDHMFS